MSAPSITLPALPSPLTAAGDPATILASGEALTIAAPGLTDLFCDPQGERPILNAPRLLFPPAAQFTLSARVSVDFQSTYDAGVLLIYVKERSWAKLCFELSPQGQPMVVSVVTNGLSDDSNALTLNRREVFLRVSGLGRAFAFHYSLDAASWQLVRYFALHESDGAQIGFSSQSPTGAGCQSQFDSIHYTPAPVSDIRSGE